MGNIQVLGYPTGEARKYLSEVVKSGDAHSNASNGETITPRTPNQPET